MKKTLLFFAGMIMLCLVATILQAQDEEEKEKEKSPLNAATFSDFKLRNIGPALMSGRIADIAIHPGDNNTWYVAVGSGGVWNTNNAGTTWEPIFDAQSV